MARDPFKNPFSPDDADRHAIWDVLVRVDLDAFDACDWAPLAPHFDTDSFEGIVAHESADPDRWTVEFPTLEAYRLAFAGMARDFQKVQPARGTRRDLLYRMTFLEQIEVRGDRALAHKKFMADETLAGGEPFRVSKQTLYRMCRVAGSWKIAGFVGYLPLGA